MKSLAEIWQERDEKKGKEKSEGDKKEGNKKNKEK